MVAHHQIVGRLAVALQSASIAGSQNRLTTPCSGRAEQRRAAEGER